MDHCTKTSILHGHPSKSIFLGNVSNCSIFIWYTLIFLSFKITSMGKFHCSSHLISFNPDNFVCVVVNSCVKCESSYLQPLCHSAFQRLLLHFVFSHSSFMITNSGSQSTQDVFIWKSSSLIISFILLYSVM